ncbi:hypothetical protein J5TS1_39120 [Bacillus licheniformis]|nr:hypothetical protein J2TS5_31970 [Bacillus licheniformis]GIN36409.1 hypothetical protein J5TS1_39120 [Bacillus licheniformis]
MMNKGGRAEFLSGCSAGFLEKNAAKYIFIDCKRCLVLDQQGDEDEEAVSCLCRDALFVFSVCLRLLPGR